MVSCKVCSKTFSKNHFKQHLLREHNITDREYYLTFLDNDYVECQFCKKESHFNNMYKGYNPYCKQCGKKFYSREFRRQQGLITEEEEKEYREKHKKNSTNMHKRLREEDENYIKKRVPSCEEFWLNKGYDEKTAKKIISNNSKNASHKMKELKRRNPQKYKNCRPVSLGYWLLKGFSEEESKQKLSERQTTFTLEKCIEKHGEEKGRRIWQKRQDKWQKTMNGKSDEERERISKSRVAKSVSKPEKDLFDILLSEGYDVQSQFKIKQSNRNYVYDIKYKNKLVEFNGDYFHCNPEVFHESYLNKTTMKLAKDIWEYDRKKIELANVYGYDVFVVWEKQFKRNRVETLKQLLEFLND